MEGPDYENITASGLRDRLEAGDGPVLLDVREPWEFELARIEGSTLIPMSQMGERYTELDPDAETVVINSGDGLKTLDAVVNRVGPTTTIPPRYEAFTEFWKDRRP